MKTQTKKPRSSRSLAATLAVAFLVLSVVVLLISGGLQVLTSIATQQQVMAGKLQLIAQGASQPVSNFIQDKFSVLETATHLADLNRMSSAERQQTLDGLLGRDPAFRQIVLLNAQDQEIGEVSRLSQLASGRLIDRLPTDVLAQIKQGQHHISSVYIDPTTSEPLVLMVIPATSALGDFQGTLAAEVNLKFMWDLVDRLKVGEKGVAYVVDNQGNLIAFNDTARVLKGENVQNLQEVAEFVSNPSSTDTRAPLATGILGTTVVGTYAPLGTPDWAVITELPWEEAYREVIQNVIVSVAILLIISVLAGMLGVYLARRLAVPLVSLTDTASRISTGELQLEAAVGGPSEVARLATAFNGMTLQLRSLISNLEQRVAERTAELTQRGQELEKINLDLGTTTRQAERRAAQLAASAQVSRAISQVRDLDQLLPAVTNFISQAFGYYHVGIFTVDELGRFAVLRATNSEGGQRMLARGHKLMMGRQGIVGYVAGTGQPRIALDVGADAVHFDNPDLPETRSEMALPLRVGDRTFGALDVQSTQEAAFSEEDVAVLSTLADQIVIAIENARLFSQTQTALQEAEETTKRYLRQEWEQLLSTLQTTGHEYRISGVPPVGDAPLPEIEQALRQGETVIVQDNGNVPARTALAVPIKLRDQVIGVIDLHETDTERHWTDDDIAVLTAVADQAGLALENVRLIEETERLAQREKAVADAADKIHRSTEIETVLRSAVAEVGRITGRRGINIQLGFGHANTPGGNGHGTSAEGDR